MDRSIAISLPPLRRKIMRSFLVMLLLYGGLAAFILVAVFFASGITPKAIHLNYDSISASTQMREAWSALRFPWLYQNKTGDQWKKQFEMSLNFEQGNISEPGEKELVAGIQKIWKEALQLNFSTQSATFASDFSRMNQLLGQLVSVNELGMFALAEQSTTLRTRAFILTGCILLVSLCVAIYMADGLASRLASPLKEIAEALRNKPIPGERLKLPTPTSLEIRILTHEMNQLWKRLSELRMLNVEELADQRSKLEVVLESVEDAILVLDNFRNILQANQGLSRLIGVPLETLIGAKWTDLSTGSENYLKLRELINDKFEPNQTIELLLKGEVRTYSGRRREITGKSGENVGSLYLFHDLTERKQRERLKSEFIAVLSHELKTPLQSLGTASELLLKRKDQLDKDGQMLIETINEDVDRIRAVAQDFVQVGFVESHSLRLRLGRHPLSEMMLDWIKPFKLVGRDKKVGIDYERRDSDIIWADIDSVKFPWAISNLLSNAVRFSPPDSKIQIQMSQDKEHINIEIRDEGPGIPESMRKKMFDPYFQAPPSESQVPSGFLGLGLTIAKEVVEAHHGNIEYYPGDPKGAVFRIRLPVANVIG